MTHYNNHVYNRFYLYIPYVYISKPYIYMFTDDHNGALFGYHSFRYTDKWRNGSDEVEESELTVKLLHKSLSELNIFKLWFPLSNRIRES